MKAAILLLVSMILLFGCTGPAETPAGTTVTEGESVPVGEEQPSGGSVPAATEEDCEASYVFSQLSPVKLSEISQFTITATCAKDKEIVLYLNDKTAGELIVPSNDATVLKFDIVAKVDGTSNVVVKSDSETVFAETWEVDPLGSDDTEGNDYDQISNKKWLAVAFDIDNKIHIGSIKAYMKRLESSTMENSMIQVEIRSDDGGNPSQGTMATAAVPLTDTTMSNNWLYLNYDVDLNPGKYWAVFKVETEEPTIVKDTVTLHYVALDNTVPANDDTRMMNLEWSESGRVWNEGTWSPLAFDKTYSVMVSAHTH